MSALAVCPLCFEPLVEGEALARCARCDADYPRVGGVDVRTPIARATLRAARDEVLGGWAQLQKLEPRDGESPAGAAAMERGQALLERLASPVLARPAGRRRARCRSCSRRATRGGRSRRC